MKTKQEMLADRERALEVEQTDLDKLNQKLIDACKLLSKPNHKIQFYTKEELRGKAE